MSSPRPIEHTIKVPPHTAVSVDKWMDFIKPDILIVGQGHVIINSLFCTSLNHLITAPSLRAHKHVDGF